MRPRILIVALAVLAVALCLFFVRRPAVETSTPLVTNSPNVSHVENAQPARPDEIGSPSHPQTAGSHENDRQKPPQVLQQYIENKNSPIDFYGLVVDQDGNALSGVHISLKVRQWVASESAFAGQINTIDRSTEVDGRFDVHDQTGDAFDVESMSKDGYELEPGQRTFGPVGGNVSAPVIFKMWKAGVKEPLLSGSSTFNILADGRAYTIDITNAAASEGNQGNGDLVVWIKRPENITRGERFDWSCEVRAINGGLWEETNSYASMYVAPSDGYSNIFRFDARNGWGASTGTRRFYLSLKNGSEYGRVSIEVLSYFHHQVPGLIRIDYAINPTSSRTLR